MLIYVAGPYRNASAAVVRENVARAERASAELIRMDHEVICPHSMTHGWERFDIPNGAFLRNGLAQLARCDAVVLVGAWWLSEGSKEEVALANELGIPVFEGVEGLSVGKARMDVERWR